MGRDPDSVRVAPASYVFVGETRSMAEDKRALVDKMAKPIDALALLSEGLNFDFASKPMDEPFTDEELKSITGLRGILDRVVLLSGKKNPTLSDFVKFSNRGTIREHHNFVGTPKEVVDQMEEWFTQCCDGFVFAATSLPGTYEDIVRLVVPELQRRGLHQKEYKGPTLRDNLGLAKAQIGDWRTG
jgi:alkanesulfonate monooxygenase SsuD/methylene tetrahydromethanopterin reductase-like flavin-dependent oxidoreductase (luciferase family)